VSTERRLSQKTIEWASAGIAKPEYDRSKVSVGIVHFGVGAFHRSHQALVMDNLFNAGADLQWGICGVGLMPRDEEFGKDFKEQDCLYTLVEKRSDGSRSTRIIGSIIDYKYAPENPTEVISMLANPAVGIVSLTITEGGYNFDPASLLFDSTNPGVIHDLEFPQNPQTIFGFITEGLRLRMDAGLPSFTVMSCDNIQGNGHIAKEMFLAFAELRDPELATWIHKNTKFPNSMVDRITPVTTSEDIEEVSAEIGIRDNCPVVSEPFFQWVLEDAFNQGRPQFELSAGSVVQVVNDVEPYELMKLRLLNASHQALAYFGYLSGYRWVHEAARDPEMVNLLMDYMDLEATPTLRPVPGMNLAEYKAELIERFQNPEVKDTVVRLAAESSDRIPKWLVPVIREQIALGGPTKISAGIVASWARYAEGIDEQGEPIIVVDQLAGELVPIAQSQREDPLAFLRMRKLFGDLIDYKSFTDQYVHALESLWSKGAHATMAELTGSKIH